MTTFAARRPAPSRPATAAATTRAPRRRRSQPRARFAIAAAAAVTAAVATNADATWSIVLADTETREVAVGTVTCLTTLDLLAIVPVVVVGEGAGACQAAGDFNGIRRPVIFDGFVEDRPPSAILVSLSAIGGHASRQYGLVDTDGDAVTFTGASTIGWAGGVVGEDGPLRWAIQGNILAGPCVVPAIETALLTTEGDMAERLMAAMEAARDAGGDGRCSCDGAPTGCGCPPSSFGKSGHIGGMIVARVGDADDPACTAGGCADGSYFMRLNVPTQPAGAPDPVDQLRDQFDAWADARVGRIDALRTEVVGPGAIPGNGASTTLLRITPLDRADDPVTVPARTALVEHAPDSAGLATIGVPVAEPDGTWTVPLTAGLGPGQDRFRIRLDDGTTIFEVMPPPTLDHRTPGDLDGDDAIGFGDLLGVIAAWGPCPAPPAPCLADLDGSGAVDFTDLVALLAGWS